MASMKWQAVGKVRGGLPLVLTLLSLVVALTASTALAAAPGVWDLGEGNAVIRGTPFSTVYNMVLSGFNGGGWDGPGINSSAAAANPGVTALATVLNDSGGSVIWASGAAVGPEFDIPGLDPLTTSDIIIKYTYYGDADLNGLVDSDDFNLLLGGLGSSDGWLFGDFDYSGVVDSDDFNLLVGNLGRSGLGGGSAAPVPEPSTIAMIAALALCAFAWLRR